MNSTSTPATSGSTQTDRRRFARFPESFAFWYQRPEAEEPDAAFMLNLSAGGAAFLASSDAVPKVGDVVRLSEMLSSDPRMKRDEPRLPPAARVLRVDDPNARVRRVAVEFETPVLSKLRRIRPERRVAADRTGVTRRENEATIGTWSQGDARRTPGTLIGEPAQ